MLLHSQIVTNIYIFFRFLLEKFFNLSLSTLRDTDVAQESSNYIQAQILQQASATLLATANQTPSIALNLI